MGLVDQILADFETQSGHNYRIEYNDDGYIHLHTDHVRIDLTVEEFERLTTVISEGEENLREIKHGIGTK